MSELPQRRIRSYVRREGRLTPAQRQALEDLWPRYGVDVGEGALDLDALFGRVAPRVLEIGFGNGENLLHMAAIHPENDFLGIEVHRPGVGHLLQRLDEQSFTNVRVICHDAVEVLQRHLADAAFDKVLLFFPDPWPKKRHHKRRIVQPAFIELLKRKLKSGGVFHVATDWEDYAVHVLNVMTAQPELRNLAADGRNSPRPDYRPETKFERRGQRLGHAIFDLLFERT